MKSKDLAILSVVFAVVAAIFWQIGTQKPTVPDYTAPAAAPATTTTAAPKPAAASSTGTGGSMAVSTPSAPSQPAVPTSAVVFQTGDKFTTPSGLQVEILQAGSGAEAIPGKLVTVDYTGTFANGTVFDSSLNPGRSKYQFQLGAGAVIKGWDEGVAGMKVGEKRKLVIPSKLAYGPNGKGAIPPNTELTFVIELFDNPPPPAKN